MRLEQVRRIIELASDYAGDTLPARADLEFTDNLVAMLTGAAALLRETTGGIQDLEAELVSEGRHAERE